MTSGSAGRRFSTGGSFPASTSLWSEGDSLKAWARIGRSRRRNAAPERQADAHPLIRGS
jgi:hypothetical protein